MVHPAVMQLRGHSVDVTEALLFELVHVDILFFRVPWTVGWRDKSERFSPAFIENP